jgi:hypothetical protein
MNSIVTPRAQKGARAQKGSGLEISVCSFRWPHLVDHFAHRRVMQSEIGANLGQGIAVPQVRRADRAVALRFVLEPGRGDGRLDLRPARKALVTGNLS